MNRRKFIIQGSILSASLPFIKVLNTETKSPNDLYDLFKNPDAKYSPFVRWWWNGNKIEKHELARELRLLKAAGIGGVEINPVKFPARTNDLGKKSVDWLSKEWIDLFKYTCDEAKSLGLTCDLIVGSGWPFGAEWLEPNERSQAIVIGTKKLDGPLDYEVSLFELFKTADPAISSPFPGRTMEMLQVKLVPSTIESENDITDLTKQIPTGRIKCKIPAGKFVLYALVKIRGFAQVIQGAPGATGPVLNHYDKNAVEKYLNHMSGTIQEQIGPLRNYIRALFTDSLELEGANWCDDMQDEFLKRRGYDILPWLPFLLYKLETLGNTWIYEYTAQHGPQFGDMINRMRYDFEVTKAELIRERFQIPFLKWCRDNKVQSRQQAYGRGLNLLESSLDVDIPECETWIRPPGLGTDMSFIDYRIGRGYTMINKFVSSAAHLVDKKLVSCEELTNTNMVFNETLELMKVASDQSIVSGVTHSVFHGFNYGPREADFPGWVLYGTYINERNPWWPYFKKFADYKARLSAVLQQATMFADIAILPATTDVWSLYSAQNEPFPVEMCPEWQTFVWESMHQNGNGCDYLSEYIIQQSAIENGLLKYNKRAYRSIFLTQVETISIKTLQKLLAFVTAGGRIFFIEGFPYKSPGWHNNNDRDHEVQEWVAKIKKYKNNCIFVNKPASDYTNWFKEAQIKYDIIPYVKIDRPNKFVSQIRYQTNNEEILIFINSNIYEKHELTITPQSSFSKKQAWIWDAETGERYKLDGNKFTLILQPADLKLMVFDKQSTGPTYQAVSAKNAVEIKTTWHLTGNHIDNSILNTELTELKDVKELEKWLAFCGTLVYRTRVRLENVKYLDLGKVYGVSEVMFNNTNLGSKWYGNRTYKIEGLVKNGENEIEIRIVTTMGNYMKSLFDNKVAQYWTNEGRRNQPLQPMGLIGPVTVF